MESSVTINCGENRLEGLLNKNSSQKAVIVCHPHPLYGGSMDNPVVNTIVQAFCEKDYTALRFNFRGTGRSTGIFDDGKGEQDDVRSAMSMLSQNGYTHITLAGYSFGARINAEVVSRGCDVEDHIMVSPPVAFMSFDGLGTLPSTGLIVSGECDEYAPTELVRDHIKQWNISPKYEVIHACDHFYSTGLGRLKSILIEYLS